VGIIRHPVAFSRWSCELNVLYFSSTSRTLRQVLHSCANTSCLTYIHTSARLALCTPSAFAPRPYHFKASQIDYCKVLSKLDTVHTTAQLLASIVPVSFRIYYSRVLASTRRTVVVVVPPKKPRWRARANYWFSWPTTPSADEHESTNMVYTDATSFANNRIGLICWPVRTDAWNLLFCNCPHLPHKKRTPAQRRKGVFFVAPTHHTERTLTNRQDIRRAEKYEKRRMLIRSLSHDVRYYHVEFVPIVLQKARGG